MPIVWIGSVKAPKSVHENQAFDIEVMRWFLSWPFREITLFTNILGSDGTEHTDRRKFTPRWFWGRHFLNVRSIRITEETEYDIEVGYED